MKIRKLFAILLACLLLAGILGGCGAANKDYAADNYVEAPESALADMDMEYITDSSTAAGPEESGSLPQNQKLIRTINMETETEDMDAILAQVKARTGELGGYIEGQEIYNGSMYSDSRYRRASLTIRIPAEKLDGFVDHVGQISNITSNRETTEDVTLQYVAVESRIKALQTEEQTLLALMEKAETMDDLLTIEARLTDVRAELEQVTSQLRLYDNKVDYGTIYLYISEVVEYTEPEPENGWQRMGKGFVKSLKGLWNFLKEFAIFLVVALPYLVLIGGVGLGVFLIIRAGVRRKRRKNANRKKTEE